MIYLDNAATTKVADEVLASMLPCFQEFYGNPGAIYGPGTKAKKLINQSRRLIAGTLGASMEEIYFTSGGSESDNWAIKGVAKAYGKQGKHIITTSIEHPAVLNTCKALEKDGYEVTYLPVDCEGTISISDLERAIRKDTILISVMFANNEIGTIQPVEEIGRLAKEKGILFHTDAVQVYGQMPIDVKKLHIDLLSASGHKFRGPKGIGFLYVRNGVKIESFLHGGHQEQGHRAGTENVPGIVGIGKAAELAHSDLNHKMKQEIMLRDYLMKRLEAEIENCIVNGSKRDRLPGNVNVSFPGVEGESVLIMLDMRGICASGGSACTVGSLTPSHVLQAIGAEEEQARGSLRLTLSQENTMEQLDQTVEALKEIVANLRKLR